VVPPRRAGEPGEPRKASQLAEGLGLNGGRNEEEVGGVLRYRGHGCCETER